MAVHNDREELQGSADMWTLPTRTLPPSAALRHAELDDGIQPSVNDHLINGSTKNSKEVVAQTLDEGAQINFVGDKGLSALATSLQNNHYSVTALPSLDAETNTCTRYAHSLSLLHVAVEAGDVGLIHRLAYGPGDLKVHTEIGDIPLHVAMSLQG